MTYINRDPFARTELHRIQVHPNGATCSWCGGLNRRGKLYQYRTESDDGRTSAHTGKFCCKDCHDSYHNR